MVIKKEIINNLISLVSDKTGLRVAEHDVAAIQKAVMERMELKKLASPEQYLKFLGSETEQSSAELTALISPLLVGESYFFRDKGQFQLIRERILPELVERRKDDKTLNIWSAGCACGEEAYSLAISVIETLPTLEDWRIRIIGTDIHEDFLKKAHQGVYGAWSFRAVPDGALRKYFVEKNGRLELIPKVREMVEFRKGDLHKDVFPTPFGELSEMDLILCRNVFIYYKRKAAAEMIKKLAATLREGGYLITGHWELFSSPTDLLKPTMFPESLVYRRTREGEKEPFPQFQTAFQPTVLVETRRVAPAATFSPPLSQPSQENWESHYLTAEEYFVSGDYMAAIRRLDAVLEKYPRHFKGLCLLANALANIGEHEKAKEKLRLAIKANPLSPEPLLLLARIAEETGDNATAIENLKKVVYLEPSSVSAYLDLAAIHENDQEFDKAKKARQSALSILKTLPNEDVLEPYGEKVIQIIQIVERMLV